MACASFFLCLCWIPGCPKAGQIKQKWPSRVKSFNLTSLIFLPQHRSPMPVVSCKIFHTYPVFLLLSCLRQGPSSSPACPPHQISPSFATLGPNHENAAKTCGVAFPSCFFCGSYNIIKNPLNFNVPYKICALVKASTDNYFWWINQEDKYVWSSCCSIQFLLYTSPAGAIIVMFQLVVSRASSSRRSFGAAWALNYSECSQSSFLHGYQEPCVVAASR